MVKSSLKMPKKQSLLQVLEKLKLTVKQCYQTDQYKLDKNETFWIIFKHCVPPRVSHLRLFEWCLKTFIFDKQGKNAVFSGKLWVEAEELLLPILIAEILVVAWKSHWRYRSHQYHDLHAWQRQGLRPLGGFGKRRMVLSRCLALFHQIGKHERSNLSPR